jgi:hypothetical protein
MAAAPTAAFRWFLAEEVSAEVSFFDREDLDARGLVFASAATALLSFTIASPAFLLVFFEFEALRDCILLILPAEEKKCHHLFR